MIIREATLNDLDAILKLGRLLLQYENVFDETIDVNWLDSAKGADFLKERAVDSDGVVLVAEQDGKIVGYLAGGAVDAPSYRTIGKLAELEEIVVHPDCRGGNIGSQLIREFFKWSKDKGFLRAQVIVSARNERTIKLYKKMDFQEYDLVLEKEL